MNRLRSIPFVVLGLGLAFVGFLSLRHIVDNFWPFDVARLDLVRSTALGQVDATSLLQSANVEIVFAFLAALLVLTTGLTLPLSYYLNKRFVPAASFHSLVVFRQSMWVGIWLVVCTWLQMNRTLGWAVILLVASVLVIFEVMLQVRSRAAEVAE